MHLQISTLKQNDLNTYVGTHLSYDFNSIKNKLKIKTKK